MHMSAETENKSKSDQLILKEVLDEMLENNKTLKLKEIRKSWAPVHKPYFDKECSEQFEKLSQLAASQSFDLEANTGDFKKFRKRNKAVCTAYFKLLEDKRESFDEKQRQKKEKKKEASTTSTSTGVNKKIKFDEDDEDQNGMKTEKENKQPFDVGKAISKIDKKLKKGTKRKIKNEA